MSAALGLYRVQQLDNQIQRTRARLEAIERALSDNEELERASSRLAEAEAALRATERALRQSEAEVEKQQIKIRETEASLYGGSIRNPKELQDLQNEVAALKRYLATLENRQLESMLALESAQADWQQAASEQQSVQSRLSDEHHSLIEEQGSLQHDLERLAAERGAAVSALDGGVLALYEQLQGQKRGMAVAAVTDGACEACGAILTPAQQQSARSTSQFLYCPSCGRILYGA